MSPRIDLDATEALSSEAPPEGEYVATIVEIEDVKDGPKSRYIPVWFEIAEGDHMGRKLVRNCPITGKGSGIFLDLYNKATGSSLDIGEIHSVDTDDMLNETVRIVVKHETYEGEVRGQIAKVLSA